MKKQILTLALAMSFMAPLVADDAPAVDAPSTSEVEKADKPRTLRELLADNKGKLKEIEDGK